MFYVLEQASFLLKRTSSGQATGVSEALRCYPFPGIVGQLHQRLAAQPLSWYPHKRDDRLKRDGIEL